MNHSTFTEDYKAIKNIVGKTTIGTPSTNDLFEGSNLTAFFNELVGKDVVNKLRSEFVSFTDVRVGSVREMVALGIKREDAVTIKSFLAAAYDACGGRNIEKLTFTQLGSLNPNDFPEPLFCKEDAE